MQIAQLIHKTLTVADGTRIAYQIRGDGPAIVLANGLGANYLAWRHQYALFSPETYRVLCWDYRGLFGSSRPRDPSTLALQRQVADLADLMDHEEIASAVIVGWSMGVQVAFEFYRQHPDRVLGIAALSGVAGRPLDSIRGGALVKRVLPLALAASRYLAPAWVPVVSSAARWPALVPALSRVGLVGADVDQDVVSAIIGSFARLDHDVYAKTLRLMGEHDCRDVLAEVNVPTSIVCGTRDSFVPLELAQAMRATIPGATLTTIEGGTHYSALERPAAVNDALMDLVRRALQAPAPGRTN